MRVKFWGVRGSIPTPLTPKEVERKVISMAEAVVQAGITNPELVAGYLRDHYSKFLRRTVGGNTTCVSITFDSSIVILDAGTGIRELGRVMMDGVYGNAGGEIHLLMSHTHWDHIMGFPFFAPLFQKNTIHIYGGIDDLEERFRGQQAPAYFPISLDIFPANIIFHKVDELKSYPLPGGANFVPKLLHHPGGCYGYKINHRGKSVVFATDSEYKSADASHNEKVIQFFTGADLLIFDSQYSFEESKSREDWGHSNAVVGVDIAIKAKVRKLALFHHEPTYPDSFILEQLQTARRYKNLEFPDADLDIFVAMEGQEVKI